MKEHGYPPTVREFGELIGVKSTSSAFPESSSWSKWIYPQNPGITKSNRDFIVRCRHEQSICRCSGRVSERRAAGSHIFTWEDGRKYSIDRILKIERCASRKAGGVGMMYTCMIQGQESHLFYEVDKWFMERKQHKERLV